MYTRAHTHTLTCTYARTHAAQVDGSALGQHMEDFYLATLKEAVLAADPSLAQQVEAALNAAAGSGDSSSKSGGDNP